MSGNAGSNTSPGQISGNSGGWPNVGDTTAFDPSNVNLTAVVEQGLMQQVTCYLTAGENEYNGMLGARISALFVVLIVSSATTFFPVLVTRSKKLRVPLYVYLFARYFGAGVIIATAFIHLLDPAYDEIGPASCVGMTGGWAEYSWPPALALTSGMFVFLMDFYAERYVEKKYGFKHGTSANQDQAAIRSGSVDPAMMAYEIDRRRSTHQALHSGEQDGTLGALRPGNEQDPKSIEDGTNSSDGKNGGHVSFNEKDGDSVMLERSFRQQIAAFLILEFGVIFHSAIIGLTLGTAGDEFGVLYPVIVFHQSFEGLGIGARLSAIPFPKHLKSMPYLLCAAYGLTTPIAIAVGLGVRTTYNPASQTANIVSGVLDSISAGILIYTGFVELLARDFLFNPDRTDNDKQLTFMIISVLLGAGIMALLGKWA
ncbi:Zinc-regulated transporter 1 [Pseudocercospora fuligena]|uniref:Zinc-regulated transporter 1 n=1 Tax=Pseudocercospora fuligena TaxID=685502 RepID=A0A8H6RMF9_9PEZI|nr:Zinc-regulated transporter 1 [Pseudocercospora fuligena]